MSENKFGFVVFKDFDKARDIFKEANELPKIERAKALARFEKSFEEAELPDGLKGIESIDNISFGHFKVLEKILSADIDKNKKNRLIAKYVIRPEKEKLLDNSDKANENFHEKKIDELPVGVVLKAVNDFLEVRDTYLNKRFRGVIYEAPRDNDDEDDEEIDDKDLKRSVIMRRNHEKQFFWHKLTKIVMNGFNVDYETAENIFMSNAIYEIAEQRSEDMILRQEQLEKGSKL